MQNEYVKWFKLLISGLFFFIIGVVLLAFWHSSLTGEVKRASKERDGLKKNIRKIESLEKDNRSFVKDVLRYRAVDRCFLELIKEYEGKFTSEDKKNCVQIIAVTEEKFRHKGIDAPMIFAWLEIESDGNPEAVSYAGAKGLTQLMDFRAGEIFTKLGYPGFDKKLVFDPVVNLAGGIHHLDSLVNYWAEEGIKNQSLVLFYAIHSYKWGSKNTEQLFDSERRSLRPAIKYVDMILNRREYWAKKMEFITNSPQESVGKSRPILTESSEDGR